MTAADHLDAAADLIGAKGAWTQDALARDAAGQPVGPESDRAVCFCIAGALFRNDSMTALEARSAFRDMAASHGISVWNDEPGRTQAEAVAALRQVAAKLRKREPAR